MFSSPMAKQVDSGANLRFRSAQSSVVGEVCEDFIPVRSLSPETDTEGMFARLLESNLSDDIRDKSSEAEGNGRRRPQFTPPHMEQNGGRFSSSAALQMMDSNANQVRHGSSPSALFAHLNAENGYDMMRGAGGFRNGSTSTGQQASRLKGQLSYSSRQNSIMSQISEVGTEGINHSSPEGSIGQYYNPTIFAAPWDDSSSLVSENNLSGIKRGREDERKIVASLNLSETQNGGMRSSVSLVNHQFSLPKTLSEMQAIEKLFQMQDSVPCKIRAKRGCATHPRSIAERVRRTRISERMKKLQELVPNMDKQTNTSDMLDIAVDYIKDLERQVKALAECRNSCSCSSTRLKSFSNH